MILGARSAWPETPKFYRFKRFNDSQAGRRGFESRLPLHFPENTAVQVLHGNPRKEIRCAAMRDLFSQFVRDRRYLKGVSSRTEGWYWQSWNAFASVLQDRTPNQVSKAYFLSRIEAMRQQGVSAITINSYSRAINAFLRWLHEEGHSAAPVRIPRMKEEQKVIATLRAEQVRRLLEYRPKGLNSTRAWTLATLVLDTGMRLNEALSLRVENLDFDNLLITVRDGKGGKQRIVPMSIQLRKILYTYTQRHVSFGGLVFYAGDGVKVLQNNIRRDFGAITWRLKISGVKGGFHVLRHTFAVNYLRAGGNVFYLQRILGHSTLEMTNRYVRSLGIEDLQAVHNRLSLLARL